jgi:hypothetical protein
MYRRLACPLAGAGVPRAQEVLSSLRECIPIEEVSLQDHGPAQHEERNARSDSASDTKVLGSAFYGSRLRNRQGEPSKEPPCALLIHPTIYLPMYEADA